MTDTVTDARRSRIPRFTRGDVAGITYLVTNNIVNYIIVIAALSAMNWPHELIFGRVVPGLSLGLMAGCIYYAYMARKLSRRTGRSDITALPSGISTPAMFVILYGVVYPLSYRFEPEEAWAAATAACFIGGMIEFLGGIIGPWVKKQLPRAALLGTVAGIGFIWMTTQGVFDVLADPIVGLPILMVAMLGLFAGYVFPKRVSPFLVAILGGIVYALALGRTSFDFSTVGLYVPNPQTTFAALVNGFVHVAPFLTVVIPVEIYNFIETMDNVESANVAGDEFSVREAQFVDGASTMLSACFGGIVPNTVWLGHPGLKKSGAGQAYSWISGLILGAAGFFGLFGFLSQLVPPAVVAVTFVWCSIIMLAQAFKACTPKHYAAIGMAMLPSVADFLYSQVTGAMGANDVWTEVLASGLTDYAEPIRQSLIDAGVMWNGVAATRAGAIVIGLLLGSITAMMTDRRLDRAAVVAAVGAIAACFGFIHSAELGFYPQSPWFLGWGIVAILFFVLHLGRDSWFRAPEDFEYV